MILCPFYTVSIRRIHLEWMGWAVSVDFIDVWTTFTVFNLIRTMPTSIFFQNPLPSFKSRQEARSAEAIWLHGWKFKIYKNPDFRNSILKLAICPLNIYNFKFKWSIVFGQTEISLKKNYYNFPNSIFWGWLSMESQPQNPDFRNNPENFHPCIYQ